MRRLLKVQCDGDWSRVTADDDGSFIVHNNAAQARRFVFGTSVLDGSTPAPPAAKTRKPPAKKPANKPPAKKAKPEPDPQLAALATLVGSQAPQKIVPGVRILGTTSVIEPESQQSELLISEGIGLAPDWAVLDVDLTAFRLMELCRKGLPESIGFETKPDVLALYGMDMTLIEAAIRNPERVEVRPETRQKKYPILGFHRGDIMAVLGMRLPHRPAIIAAYAASRLEPDNVHVPGSGTGGGGARKQTGLPSTVRASIKTLRTHGAKIDDGGELFGEKNVEVFYQGQSLGRICLGDNVPRDTVRSDYQRTLRKINAIKQREGVAV